MPRHAIAVLMLASLAHADVAFDNFGPGSTFTGNGFLVRGPQATPWWTHAFPITPTASGEITTVTVAMNHLGGATNNYFFELRADNAGSPGAVIAVLGQVSGFAGGSVPVQFSAAPGTSITANTPYWIYARGDGDANGTWLASPNAGGFRAYSFDGGTAFTVMPIAPPVGQGAIRIEVAGSSGGCYPNCDGTTAVPVLTANDFVCFLEAYAAASSYANCDGSTGSPTLTANDFTCFVTAYVIGCT